MSDTISIADVFFRSIKIDYLGWDTYHYSSIGDIFSNNRVGTDLHIIPNLNWPKDFGSRPDKHPIPYLRNAAFFAFTTNANRYVMAQVAKFTNFSGWANDNSTKVSDV
jgi:hypothetical protein